MIESEEDDDGRDSGASGEETKASAIREAISSIEDGTIAQEVIAELLADGVLDAEQASDIGVVTATRVYQAHAALRRLNELLSTAPTEGT